MSLMRQEAEQSASIVEALLRQNQSVCRDVASRWRASPPRLVLTCARGSSDHAATFAKYLIERWCGIPVASAAPSLSSLYSRRLALDGALVIAISQSGQSADLLAFMEDARKAGAETVAIVNDEQAPLAGTVDTILPMHAGPERSVAATKTFIASLAAVAQLVAHWSGDAALLAGLARLPSALEACALAAPETVVRHLARQQSMFVLGRGAAFGIAGEAALKLKETCQIHAEAFSPAEVLHGPMAIVGPGFPVLAFLQDDESAATTASTLVRLRKAGAHVTTIGTSGVAADIPVAATEASVLALLPAILRFYGLAEALSRARGCDPDTPRHLQKVTVSR